MILLIIGFVIIVLYYYGTRNFDYWEKRGVKYEKPIIFFGGYLKQYIDNMSLSERFATLHRAYPNERFVGYFEGNSPALLIRDPELIRHVLLTDFRYFHHRGIIPYSDVIEPLMKNLFTIDGDIWKLMRQKLTPTFTSGKLKGMFPLIVERTEKLAKLADEAAESGEEVDVRELMGRYTTDFIGACGFGIDSQALSDDNSDFRKLGKRIVKLTKRDIAMNVLKRTFPAMFKYAHYFSPEVENKTMSIVKQIMLQRNHQPSGRNDFIDLLLELKQKGKIIGESLEKHNPDGSPATVELDVTDELIAAQVFLFFLAGFETSSSTSSYLLHILAYHPEVQERCHREIDEVLAKYDGKLCFDAVKDMKYLEMAFSIRYDGSQRLDLTDFIDMYRSSKYWTYNFFVTSIHPYSQTFAFIILVGLDDNATSRDLLAKESMRFLTFPGFLIRRTVSKYTIPGSNVTLDEGSVVIISTEAMSTDEQYFEEPEVYKPERFHPDNIGNIKKCTFMPFGDGPRSCIGERLGIMQSLAGVAVILSKFTVTPSRSSLREPRIDPRSIVFKTIVGGLPLALQRRQKSKIN